MAMRRLGSALALCLACGVAFAGDDWTVIAGRVVDSNGRPAGGVRVGALEHGPLVLFRGGNQPPTLDNLYSTTTQTDGEFSLRLFRYSQAWSIWARDDAEGSIGAVTVADLPAGPLEIRLAPASYIHSGIIDADGQPLRSAETGLTLVRTGLALQGQNSDERGDLRVGPLPAGVPLRIYPTRVHLYLALTEEWLDDDRAEITLAPGETREFPPLRVGVRMRTVKGTVVLHDGRPVSGAKVRSIIPSVFPVSSETDREGRFALTGLLPTKDGLWVLASHPTEPLHVVQTLGPATEECRLRLRPLTNAEGQLADAQGRPVVGAEVEPDRALRIGEGRGEEYWQADGLPLPGRQVARTDTEGYFSLGGLVSGAPYVAWVRASDVHFDYWRIAFVANADDPVNLGVVFAER
jgi:hypothetical protein